MATTAAPAKPRISEQLPTDLSPEALLEMYWHMLRSRRLDERAWTLHRQGKIAFHISAMGHEAGPCGGGLRPAPRLRLCRALLPRSEPDAGPGLHRARFLPGAVRQAGR